MCADLLTSQAHAFSQSPFFWKSWCAKDWLQVMLLHACTVDFSVCGKYLSLELLVVTKCRNQWDYMQSHQPVCTSWVILCQVHWKTESQGIKVPPGFTSQHFKWCRFSKTRKELYMHTSAFCSLFATVNSWFPSLSAFWQQKLPAGGNDLCMPFQALLRQSWLDNYLASRWHHQYRQAPNRLGINSPDSVLLWIWNLTGLPGLTPETTWVVPVH